MTGPAVRWRGPVAALGACCAVYLLGTWAVWFTPDRGTVAYWWPAAGVSVVLVALAPRSWWPVLALGIAVFSAAANITAGRPPTVSACFGAANAAEAVVAGLLLKGRGGRLLDLGELGDFLRLVRATLAGAAVIGLGAAATVAGFDHGPFWMVFRNVFTSHAAAVLVIVPLAMTWRLRSGVARRPEYVVQVSVGVAVAVLVFAPPGTFPLSFATLPVLVWAALRLDPRTVAIELLASSVVAIGFTAQGRGPFGAEIDGGIVPTELSAPLVQAYVLATALIALPLTLALTQRTRTLTALHDALEAARAADRLTSATLDTTPCIILVSEMDGTVVRVNQGATALTGFPADQILGKPVWATLVPPYRVPLVREMFASPDGSSIPGTREANVRTADGETLRVVWNNDLVRDADGVPRYAVMTGVDVTAERTTSGLMGHLLQAGMSTAIIGIDHRGRITLFNSGAESLVGRTAEEMRGTPFVDILDPDELAERTDGSADAGWSALTALHDADGESVVRDWTWRTPGGARRTVAMSLSGGGSEFGPQAGWLAVGRDVTEERHGQKMLMVALQRERLAADRLRELDSAKNEFVSTVSHELRTPVTSIVGYTEMLADGEVVPPDPAQLPLLDTIARNGQRLIALCNDLLTLSGLDSTEAAWDRSAVDLCELAQHTEDSLRPTLRDRDLTVSFEIPADPVRVLGDAVQLERVIVNLLSNALKFTEDGGRVTTSLGRVDGEARLVVADTGIGIPESEQAGLFQRFFRASTAQELAIQGTGLGLSIVAGIVAAHGGAIDVRSASGVGTTLTVRLPLHQD